MGWTFCTVVPKSLHKFNYLACRWQNVMTESAFYLANVKMPFDVFMRNMQILILNTFQPQSQTWKYSMPYPRKCVNRTADLLNTFKTNCCCQTCINFYIIYVTTFLYYLSEHLHFFFLCKHCYLFLRRWKCYTPPPPPIRKEDNAM